MRGIDNLMKAAEAQALVNGDPLPMTLGAIRRFVATDAEQKAQD
jgi:hypothetical protein